MLAATLERIEDVKFPVLVSPKIDGIRCVIRDGVPYTRKLKPIPNRSIRERLNGLPNFDGEIVVGSVVGSHGFDATQSGVMSHDGEPEFTYWVFDMAVEDAVGFEDRLARAATRADMYDPMVQSLSHFLARDPSELRQWEELYVEQGYEGLMIRDPQGPYKHGRSTLREGYLLKMIRRQTAEAIVVGTLPLMHNQNEKGVSELGLSKRSKKKANLVVDDGRMGKLVCRWLESHHEFEIGTGFTDAQRQELWLPGTIVTFEFREITKDGAPRFPSFKGRRDTDDVGEPA
jgi:DNA ligase-1